MAEAFKGTEATSRGLSRGRLRWNYAAIFPDVYVSKHAARTLRLNTVGAWLWSGRDGVIAGRAAAALHGARWVEAATPIEMIWRNGRPPKGIVVRNERIDADELVEINGMMVTNPARTAWDIGRHLPRNLAVPHLDALSRATGVTAGDCLLLAARHPRARGLRRSTVALHLMDPGAESPKESWLRLVLLDGGLPPPSTQIRVANGHTVAYLDMGWEAAMVAIEYDGEHHRTDRRQYAKDVHRSEMLRDHGWWVIRVIKEDRPAVIVARVREALARRSASRLQSGL
ncbi:endonuclease domain-containing protein [Mycolicibacter minnesotensis]